MLEPSTQQGLIISFQKVRDDLKRRQTDHANKLSAATAARARAQGAAAEAQRRQDDAVTALQEAQQIFAARQHEINRLPPNVTRRKPDSVPPGR